jgi:hypothetical protein
MAQPRELRAAQRSPDGTKARHKVLESLDSGAGTAEAEEDDGVAGGYDPPGKLAATL